MKRWLSVCAVSFLIGGCFDPPVDYHAFSYAMHDDRIFRVDYASAPNNGELNFVVFTSGGNPLCEYPSIHVVHYSGRSFLRQAYIENRLEFYNIKNSKCAWQVTDGRVTERRPINFSVADLRAYLKKHQGKGPVTLAGMSSEMASKERDRRK